MTPPPRDIRARQLLAPALALASVVCAGGVALWLLSGRRWTLSESIFFAIISATTVGYGEIDHIGEVPGARIVTALVILGGLIVVAYFQSSLTAFLFEGVLGHRFRTRRMKQRISALSDHIVVAGAGSTGRHVIAELIATNTPFVLVERSEQSIADLLESLNQREILHVLGDATHDAVLLAAGVSRARGIVAALTEDRDNLYVTLSARDLNAKARIVTKVIEAEAEHKMLRAGANSTVSPNRIGGMRMASEMLRPTAVRFLDRMLQAKGGVLRVEEVAVPADSWFVGKALKDLPIRAHANALVVAIQDGDEFDYNPIPTTVLAAGNALVVIADVANIERLRTLARRSTPP
ncbi:MAG: potassium channel protein [Deltaproteobacteria bacterium]|nr:potassium channel protein [Deltaproteobacteria bacterium]